MLRLAVAALAAVAVLAPLAAAQGAPVAALPANASCASAAAPPCGYITPFLTLTFPTKPKCTGTPGSIDPAKCIPLPADGASVTFPGSLVWSWRESEDLTYPEDPAGNIELSFAGIGTNPSWLTFKVDPPTFSISQADLANPTYLKPDQSTGTPIVWYWYEKPVNVTFTRHGSPTGDELQRLEDRGGILQVYVKAKSSESQNGFFKAAFGGTEFRYNATSLLAPAAAPAKASPMPPALAVPAVALAAASAVRLRRRGRSAR